jgi:hypothetical protein
MICMHCHIEFDENKDWGWVEIYENPNEYDDAWEKLEIYDASCPRCTGSNLFYALRGESEGLREISGILNPIWPLTTHENKSCPPCPFEVPHSIQDDYNEACLVAQISPKASAALRRRCLQNLLRDVAMVKPSDLSKEIQEVIDSGKLPSHFVESIDAIRNIGNFAAHPAKSKSTGEIVAVEPEEAEWNLDVLESLFDFYNVQPAVLAKKCVALNAKLQEAGKPPMK